MEAEIQEQRIFQWGSSRRFNAYAGYFRNKYGTRVQKVSLDAGFTCPNRDGSKGSGGCTFCDNSAFNPSYCNPDKPITQQIEEGIDFHKWRYDRAVSYLAYFQAYSNTYGSFEALKQKYEEALAYPGVIGLIIGTRPDCVERQLLEYLASLNEKYYVAIEYGIESCYNKTLLRINRGHTFEDAAEAVKKTAAAGISTGAHFIFGLPGESEQDMFDEAEIISDLPLTTVKFHQLQIIRGTRMEDEFFAKREDFKVFSWEEYVDFFVKFLERINPAFVVERFTGEVPPRFLRTGGWDRMRSDTLINIIEKRLQETDTWQGRLYTKNSK